jgi:hypothetical protein
MTGKHAAKLGETRTASDDKPAKDIDSAYSCRRGWIGRENAAVTGISASLNDPTVPSAERN